MPQQKNPSSQSVRMKKQRKPPSYFSLVHDSMIL